MELWGTASKSHLQLIQRTQSKMLRIITKAEWYIIHNDLNIETVNKTIKKKAAKTHK